MDIELPICLEIKVALQLRDSVANNKNILLDRDVLLIHNTEEAKNKLNQVDLKEFLKYRYEPLDEKLCAFYMLSLYGEVIFKPTYKKNPKVSFYIPETETYYSVYSSYKNKDHVIEYFDPQTILENTNES
jgi:hypothetical protein